MRCRLWQDGFDREDVYFRLGLLFTQLLHFAFFKKLAKTFCSLLEFLAHSKPNNSKKANIIYYLPFNKCFIRPVWKFMKFISVCFRICFKQVLYSYLAVFLLAVDFQCFSLRNWNSFKVFCMHLADLFMILPILVQFCDVSDCLANNFCKTIEGNRKKIVVFIENRENVTKTEIFGRRNIRKFKLHFILSKHFLELFKFLNVWIYFLYNLYFF